MILVKTALSDLRRMAHPRSVNPVQIDGKRVAPETVKAVHTYFVLYIFIILGCTLLISLDGFDTATNFSASLACLSNIGPGLVECPLHHVACGADACYVVGRCGDVVDGAYGIAALWCVGLYEFEGSVFCHEG